MTPFFFNDTATPEIYTLSLHDALPICPSPRRGEDRNAEVPGQPDRALGVVAVLVSEGDAAQRAQIHGGGLGPAGDLAGAEPGVEWQRHPPGDHRPRAAAGPRAH